MAMFDTVFVPCPRCGALKEYQSKAGDCTLEEYNIYDAPLAILADIQEGCAWPKNNRCYECDYEFKILVQKMVQVL